MEITDKPARAPEKDTLLAFLDRCRDLLLWKIDGLDDEQLRRRMTPTGMSPLGVVKHLAYVERGWFRICFAGETIPPEDTPYDDADPTMDWRIDPHETTGAIVDLYRRECARSREIATAADLDTVSAVPTTRRGPVSLRFILVHMIEETARHLGHIDVMREAIDGAVGDFPNGTPVVPLD